MIFISILSKQMKACHVTAVKANPNKSHCTDKILTFLSTVYTSKFLAVAIGRKVHFYDVFLTCAKIEGRR